MEQPREALTWSDFDTSAWRLAERIADDDVADHVGRDSDRRITFPWSDRPPVTGRGVHDA